MKLISNVAYSDLGNRTCQLRAVGRSQSLITADGACLTGPSANRPESLESFNGRTLQVRNTGAAGHARDASRYGPRLKCKQLSEWINYRVQVRKFKAAWTLPPSQIQLRFG